MSLVLRFVLPLAIVLPWLNPFATGPSSALVPWLVSLACMASVVLIWPQVRTIDIATSWMFAALVSAVFGLIQYFSFAESFSPWINTTAAGEAFANLRQRNQFASLTNIGLLALVWVALVWFAQSKFLPREWLLAGAVLLGIGNAASSSRTGLLQLVMLTGLLMLWGALRVPLVRHLVLAAALSYALASLALPLLIGLEFGASGILGRLTDGGAACSSRLVLWRNVLDLISLKPWFGWGWGELDYAHFISLYAGEPAKNATRFCEILDNAHNLPLHLAVELGVPFALLMCGSGLWLVWRAKPWFELNATRQLAWGVLAVILLHSLLEYPLWYGPFQMAFGLCMWLLVTTPGRSISSLTTNVVKNGTFGPQNGDFSGLRVNYGRNRPLALVFIRLFAILTIVFVAYAGWDYHRISQIYLAPAQRSDGYRTDTLAKIQGSWLFRNQVRFAELTTTPVTPENAMQINAMAHKVLHFSPEARVVEKLIDSAMLLGRLDEVRFFSARYRAAYRQEYENWLNTGSTLPAN